MNAACEQVWISLEERLQTLERRVLPNSNSRMEENEEVKSKVTSSRILERLKTIQLRLDRIEPVEYRNLREKWGNTWPWMVRVKKERTMQTCEGWTEEMKKEMLSNMEEKLKIVVEQGAVLQEKIKYVDVPQLDHIDRFKNQLKDLTEMEIKQEKMGTILLKKTILLLDAYQIYVREVSQALLAWDIYLNTLIKEQQIKKEDLWTNKMEKDAEI